MLRQKQVLHAKNILNEVLGEQKKIEDEGGLEELEDILFRFIEQSNNLVELRELVYASFGPLALKRYGGAIDNLWYILSYKGNARIAYRESFAEAFNSERLLRQLATDAVLSQQLWEVVPQDS